MHDYTPKSIRLLQADPQDPRRQTRVLLSLAHVVRLVPQYYVESGGKRMVTNVDVDPDSARASEHGLKRFFLILDDLGGQFESHTASEGGQALLEQMWHESA